MVSLSLLMSTPGFVPNVRALVDRGTRRDSSEDASTTNPICEDPAREWHRRYGSAEDRGDAARPQAGAEGEPSGCPDRDPALLQAWNRALAAPATGGPVLRRGARPAQAARHL